MKNPALRYPAGEHGGSIAKVHATMTQIVKIRVNHLCTHLQSLVVFSLRPFSIGCYAETNDGKNCLHCNGLHKPCETVPEGIEGHRFELLACLSWVEEFWSNCEGGFGVVLDGNDSDKESEFLLPRALVDSVAACIHHLIASFDKFVKAHRRAHSLTGTNLPQAYLGRSLALSHWCFVSAHVALLSPPPPPPHSTQYESEWAALIAESTRSHRLRITEESVRSWYSGIVALRQDLNDIVQEFVDDSEVGEAIAVKYC
ncbi:hypothetical protein Pdw03_5801 [Penicillium digitatum]|uniref:Uncharacterized protein n=1 Tax=Penicillium digitatum TaxID=36651 RepID=A0A7T7BQB2_PENDI|nr:hypothetical protein Pdw03_5801 [Penicillium digitatum]